MKVGKDILDSVVCLTGEQPLPLGEGSGQNQRSGTEQPGECLPRGRVQAQDNPKTKPDEGLDAAVDSVI